VKLSDLRAMYSRPAARVRQPNLIACASYAAVQFFVYDDRSVRAEGTIAGGDEFKMTTTIDGLLEATTDASDEADYAGDRTRLLRFGEFVKRSFGRLPVYVEATGDPDEGGVAAQLIVEVVCAEMIEELTK
jgi:hypothetical protein